MQQSSGKNIKEKPSKLIGQATANKQRINPHSLMMLPDWVMKCLKGNNQRGLPLNSKRKKVVNWANKFDLTLTGSTPNYFLRKFTWVSPQSTVF